MVSLLQHFDHSMPITFPEGTESKYSNSYSPPESRQTLGNSRKAAAGTSCQCLAARPVDLATDGYLLSGLAYTCKCSFSLLWHQQAPELKRAVPFRSRNFKMIKWLETTEFYQHLTTALEQKEEASRKRQQKRVLFQLSLFSLLHDDWRFVNERDYTPLF